MQNGKIDVDPGKFFEAARDARTRGHHHKLFERPAGSFGIRIFSARAVDSCNLYLGPKHWGPERQKNLRFP